MIAIRKKYAAESDHVIHNFDLILLIITSVMPQISLASLVLDVYVLRGKADKT